MEKVYSLDGSIFMSLEDLGYELGNQLEHKVGDIVQVWYGDSVPYQHKDFLSIGSIIENMQENTYEHDMDRGYTENYLEDLGSTHKKELEGVILKWLNENAEQPTFYAVKNEKQTTIIYEGE